MRTVSLPLVAVALLLVAMVPGRADEFKPGYLQLTQLDRETYDVLWKIPAIDESTTLKVKPQFPDGTEALTEVRSTFSRGITVQRWRIRVPDGLDGKAIFFSQLSETRIDVLARLVRLDGTVQLERILPVQPQLRRQAQPWPAGSRQDVYDPRDRTHPVRVRSPPVRARAGAAGAGHPATARHHHGVHAAHSLTLAGATLGWVHVPGPPSKRRLR